jgi:hypothetical protein
VVAKRIRLALTSLHHAEPGWGGQVWSLGHKV